MKNKDEKNKKKEWPPTLEEYLAGQEHSDVYGLFNMPTEVDKKINLQIEKDKKINLPTREDKKINMQTEEDKKINMQTTSESEVYLPNTNVNLPFVEINSITAVEGEIDKATAAKEINLLTMETVVPQPVQMMDVDTPEEAHIHQNNASTSQVRR